VRRMPRRGAWLCAHLSALWLACCESCGVQGCCPVSIGTNRGARAPCCTDGVEVMAINCKFGVNLATPNPLGRGIITTRQGLTSL